MYDKNVMQTNLVLLLDMLLNEPFWEILLNLKLDNFFKPKQSCYVQNSL